MLKLITTVTRNGLCLMAALLCACGQPSAAAEGHWIRTAAAALMWQKSGPSERVGNQTVRFPVRLTLGGHTFRLTLSQAYAATEVRIGRVTVSGWHGAQEIISTLTFSGQETFQISARAPALSDAFEADLDDNQVVWVSIYLPDQVLLSTFHRDRTSTLVSVAGDYTRATTVHYPVASRLALRPFFAGIDVARGQGATLVALGDSITDGNDDAASPATRWSDVLARRLQGSGKIYGVATEAIFGNQLLHDNSGDSALSRFDRDVLSLPNVRYVVVLLGINDIGHIGDKTLPPVTADDIIAGYGQLIARAHAHGIKVYASPLLPFEGAPYASEAKEHVRLKVNQWIRTTTALDAVIDLASVVADPDHPSRLNPSLERGDHLHPNAEGEARMGAAIPLSLFR